jgi:hypothetical protein
MRKALVVGINDYPTSPLYACIKDATAFGTILESNGDGSPNFSVRLYIDIKTKPILSELVADLFSGTPEIALFYFAGHGFEDKLGGYLVTPDAKKPEQGYPMEDLVKLANQSKAANRIIILDCCHAGSAGTAKIIGSALTLINNGVTILTACKDDETSMEVNGYGVFTNLLIDALQGGAADITGNITPGSIYSYIDKALGPWDQRPVFKTNITQFTSLRKVNAKVPDEILRKLTEYFPSSDGHHVLDPSYEDTNAENIDHVLVTPHANPDHVAIFKHLQKLQSAGLVVPVNTDHMYFAAMESKSCQLTALGYHYWRLVKDKRI